MENWELRIKKIMLIVFLIPYILVAKSNDTIYESASDTVIKQKKIKQINEKINYQVTFNKGVLALENNEFKKAIKLFKKSAPYLKIPSFLNIGIAYYKLGSNNNAYLYLKKIYDIKQTLKYDPYSYLSATYYLYLITQDKNYLVSIINSYKKLSFLKLNENTKNLIVDTFIMLGDYKAAFKLITKLKKYDFRKVALLSLILKKYKKADIYLKKALNDVIDEQTYNDLLWFLIYNDLKRNNIEIAKQHIQELDQRLYFFNSNKKFPLKLYFNPDKLTYKDYYNRLIHFDLNRKIDLIYYFAPFIFIDKKLINKNIVYSFVLKNMQSLNSLNLLIGYNKQFIDYVKFDPIIRTKKLQNLLELKISPSSYEYYNLGLSYAQIFNYTKAYIYFKKAYDLDRGNKLYAAMTLITAKKLNLKLKKIFKRDINTNILKKGGRFSYIGKYIYKLIFNPALKISKSELSSDEYSSFFIRSLYFIENSQKYGFLADEPLFNKNLKDPLVYLMSLLIKKEKENEFKYRARVQDSIPKVFNDYFLKGPLFLTQYYLDLVRAFGLLKVVDFRIGNLKEKNLPSYLRTLAYVDLFINKYKNSLQILEKLFDKYKLDDKYSYFLLTAAYLANKDINNALITLDILRFEYQDIQAKFLTGIGLLQNLKLISASSAFKTKYANELVDFKLLNLENYLQNL